MVDLSKLPKNNAVNKFWASVEPYCADITNEDLKFLEELLRSHEDDSDYFKVGLTYGPNCLKMKKMIWATSWENLF